jgi:hypothetical protein
MGIRAWLDRFLRRHGTSIADTADPPPVSLVVVRHGEHRRGGTLTLQGSIQAGLVAKTLATDPVRRVIAIDRPYCSDTAAKIAERHRSVTVETVERPTISLLVQLVDEHPGETIVLVVDDSQLDYLFALLEERSPGGDVHRRVAPASITRVTLAQDLSYRMRFNDTAHLDQIVSSRIAGSDAL